MEFGEHLKEWRSHRRMSQLELANEAGISSRHLSFLETGRSRPSEGMILRLSAVLDIPARDQGLLFSAAGFRPRFGTAPAKSLASVPPAVAEAIVRRCAALRPEIAGARVLEHRVGLRPARSAVRLERELLPDGRVVGHNYGHGGGGVTVAWGCAAGAAIS